MKIRLSVGTTLQLAGKYYKATADLEDEIGIALDDAISEEAPREQIEEKFADICELLSGVVVNSLSTISKTVEDALE